MRHDANNIRLFSGMARTLGLALKKQPSSFGAVVIMSLGRLWPRSNGDCGE